MEGNMQEYLTEKKAREKRLAVYTEKIQETVLNKSAETIRLLVEERHNQKMTQQELSDITGIQPSNLARFESGGRDHIGVRPCVQRRVYSPVGGSPIK